MVYGWDPQVQGVAVEGEVLVDQIVEEEGEVVLHQTGEGEEEVQTGEGVEERELLMYQTV